MKHVPPSIALTAFNCPRCGAFAQQFWKRLWCEEIQNNGKPSLVKHPLQVDIVDELTERFVTTTGNRDGEDFFTKRTNYSTGSQDQLINVSVARCYNCKELSLWLYDKLLSPSQGHAPVANPDMPSDIRRDYEEAGAILQQSPRGAAALLRLAIQKLCKELGQKGKNINEDISALVKAGLDQRVQQALDIVRVIGNSAVHPGQIDLRDDRASAETLFKLVNVIVEKTISQPKHIEELYKNLPDNALEAIQKRDS